MSCFWLHLWFILLCYEHSSNFIKTMISFWNLILSFSLVHQLDTEFLVFFNREMFCKIIPTPFLMLFLYPLYAACEFESKWKKVSRKISYEKKEDDVGKQLDNQTLRLLKHRQRALGKVKCLFDCSHFEFDWKLDPFWFFIWVVVFLFLLQIFIYLFSILWIEIMIVYKINISCLKLC